jgi:3-dehydroquinate synthase
VSPKTLRITVPSTDARSPLWVGRNIFPTLPSLVEASRYSRVLIVSDSGAQEIAAQVSKSLSSPPDAVFTLKGGEDCKSIERVEEVWGFFAARRLDRKSLVIGIGGGALTDMVGFAAATYMRGVAFVAVPTTLLAQVDAGIGGKTGINFGGVKNLIGIITQPVGILIDTAVLKTLPAREVRSGFAEIIKHGLIADKSYFERVTSRECTSWSEEELVDIVFRSCEIKSSVVEQDPLERGMRKALNFGHTLGHAIEAHAIKVGIPITHGEAVAIGMNAACFISEKANLLSEDDHLKCVAGIKRAGLPVTLPTVMPQERLHELLALDKKNVGGTSRWTLLRGIGSVVIDQEVPREIVDQAIRHVQPA